MLTYIMNSSCHINPRYQGTTQNQNKTSVWLPIFYCIKPSFPRYHWFFFWSWFVLGNLFFLKLKTTLEQQLNFATMWSYHLSSILEVKASPVFFGLGYTRYGGGGIEKNILQLGKGKNNLMSILPYIMSFVIEFQGYFMIFPSNIVLKEYFPEYYL